LKSPDKAGLRIVSGLVLSDRLLHAELHAGAETANLESRELIRSFHGQGNALYVVSPRFAVSTFEAILEVCQTLLAEYPGVRLQTHLNENARASDRQRPEPRWLIVLRATPLWAAVYFPCGGMWRPAFVSRWERMSRVEPALGY
jgi:cytosine/adenosine deaminase-related metal-dependent hydrolase